MSYLDFGGTQPNPGMYWFHPDRETCVTFEGVELDAFGLYPLRADALLLPSIEAGEAAACDCEPAWGGWRMRDPRDPTQFPDIMRDPPGLGSPADAVATPSSREAVAYFDRFKCVRERLDAGTAPVSRAFELARVEVAEGGVGVFEHVETGLIVELVDPSPTVTDGVVNGVDFRHMPFNPIPPDVIRPINNDPCPWPFTFQANTPGNPTAVTVACEWVWVAQGVSSVAGPRPPVVQNFPPDRIPPGVSLGPGRWRDQRYAHGLPRYGAQQVLQRGPYLVRLFAVVTVQAASLTALSVRPLGRLSGFVQQYGARERSLAAATVRRP